MTEAQTLSNVAEINEAITNTFKKILAEETERDRMIEKHVQPHKDEIKELWRGFKAKCDIDTVDAKAFYKIWKRQEIAKQLDEEDDRYRVADNLRTMFSALEKGNMLDFVDVLDNGHVPQQVKDDADAMAAEQAAAGVDGDDEGGVPIEVRDPSTDTVLFMAGASELERMAEACHEINRSYQADIGEEQSPPWADAPKWQRDSAIKGVGFVLDKPDATFADQHAEWMATKEAEGWTYGETKDEKVKTHPCLVPYDELPGEQQVKDQLFRDTVWNTAREIAGEIEPAGSA